MGPKVHSRLLDLRDTARTAAQTLRQSVPYYLGNRRGAARREWTLLAVLVVATTVVLLAMVGRQLMDQITALFS